MIKEHPTQTRLKELFKYREDGNLIRKIRTSGRVKIGDISGSISKTTGYLYVSVNSVTYLAHRLIWIYHNGFNPENDLDHIDRDKLNNSIENLREVTQSCNLRNTGNFKDNISGVKGVFWDKKRRKWYAQIVILLSHKFLGRHNDFYEAVLHRLAAEQCLDWEGCDSSSPAYRYALNNNLINEKPR